MTGQGRGKGGGRPLRPINPAVVEAMAFVGATNVEIAEFLETTPELIERRFIPLLRKNRAARRICLRRAQWRSAMNGNVPMLIWLGKQYLGQSDHPVAESTLSHELPRQSIIFGGERIFF